MRKDKRIKATLLVTILTIIAFSLTFTSLADSGNGGFTQADVENGSASSGGGEWYNSWENYSQSSSSGSGIAGTFGSVPDGFSGVGIMPFSTISVDPDTSSAESFLSAVFTGADYTAVYAALEAYAMTLVPADTAATWGAWVVTGTDPPTSSTDVRTRTATHAASGIVFKQTQTSEESDPIGSPGVYDTWDVSVTTIESTPGITYYVLRNYTGSDFLLEINNIAWTAARIAELPRLSNFSSDATGNGQLDLSGATAANFTISGFTTYGGGIILPSGTNTVTIAATPYGNNNAMTFTGGGSNLTVSQTGHSLSGSVGMLTLNAAITFSGATTATELISNGIAVNSANLTLNGNLTKTGANNVTINNGTVGNVSTSGGNITLASTVTAVTGDVTNTGSGTVTLNQNVAGAILSNSGTINVNNSSSVGSVTANTGTITVSNGITGAVNNSGSGRITVTGGVTGNVTNTSTNTNAVTINGGVTGAVTNNGSGPVNVASGVVTGNVSSSNGNVSVTGNVGGTVSNSGNNTITITGDVAGNSVTITNASASGKIVINGSVTNTAAAIVNNGTGTNAKITLQGGTYAGTITNSGAGEIEITADTATASTANISNASNGKITIKTGTFSGTVTNTTTSSGAIIIEAGTFSNTVQNSGSAELQISNGTFNATVTNSSTGNPGLTITGGTFNGRTTPALTPAINNAANSYATIKSSTISGDVNNDGTMVIGGSAAGDANAIGAITITNNGDMTLNGQDATNVTLINNGTLIMIASRLGPMDFDGTYILELQNGSTISEINLVSPGTTHKIELSGAANTIDVINVNTSTTLDVKDMDTTWVLGNISAQEGAIGAININNRGLTSLHNPNAAAVSFEGNHQIQFPNITVVDGGVSPPTQVQTITIHQAVNVLPVVEDWTSNLSGKILTYDECKYVSDFGTGGSISYLAEINVTKCFDEEYGVPTTPPSYYTYPNTGTSASPFLAVLGVTNDANGTVNLTQVDLTGSASTPHTYPTGPGTTATTYSGIRNFTMDGITNYGVRQSQFELIGTTGSTTVNFSNNHSTTNTMGVTVNPIITITGSASTLTVDNNQYDDIPHTRLVVTGSISTLNIRNQNNNSNKVIIGQTANGSGSMSFATYKAATINLGTHTAASGSAAMTEYDVQLSSSGNATGTFNFHDYDNSVLILRANGSASLANIGVPNGANLQELDLTAQNNQRLTNVPQVTAPATGAAAWTYVGDVYSPSFSNNPSKILKLDNNNIRDMGQFTATAFWSGKGISNINELHVSGNTNLAYLNTSEFANTLDYLDYGNVRASLQTVNLSNCRYIYRNSAGTLTGSGILTGLLNISSANIQRVNYSGLLQLTTGYISVDNTGASLTVPFVSSGDVLNLSGSSILAYVNLSGIENSTGDELISVNVSGSRIPLITSDNIPSSTTATGLTFFNSQFDTNSASTSTLWPAIIANNITALEEVYLYDKYMVSVSVDDAGLINKGVTINYPTPPSAAIPSTALYQLSIQNDRLTDGTGYGNRASKALDLNGCVNLTGIIGTYNDPASTSKTADIQGKLDLNYCIALPEVLEFSDNAYGGVSGHHGITEATLTNTWFTNIRINHNRAYNSSTTRTLTSVNLSNRYSDSSGTQAYIGNLELTSNALTTVINTSGGVNTGTSVIFPNQRNELQGRVFLDDNPLREVKIVAYDLEYLDIKTPFTSRGNVHNAIVNGVTMQDCDKLLAINITDAEIQDHFNLIDLDLLHSILGTRNTDPSGFVIFSTYTSIADTPDVVGPTPTDLLGGATADLDSLIVGKLQITYQTRGVYALPALPAHLQFQGHGITQANLTYAHFTEIDLRRNDMKGENLADASPENFPAAPATALVSDLQGALEFINVSNTLTGVKIKSIQVDENVLTQISSKPITNGLRVTDALFDVGSVISADKNNITNVDVQATTYSEGLGSLYLNNNLLGSINLTKMKNVTELEANRTYEGGRNTFENGSVILTGAVKLDAFAPATTLISDRELDALINRHKPRDPDEHRWEVNRSDNDGSGGYNPAKTYYTDYETYQTSIVDMWGRSAGIGTMPDDGFYNFVPLKTLNVQGCTALEVLLVPGNRLTYGNMTFLSGTSSLEFLDLSGTNDVNANNEYTLPGTQTVPQNYSSASHSGGYMYDSSSGYLTGTFRTLSEWRNSIKYVRIENNNYTSLDMDTATPAKILTVLAHNNNLQTVAVSSISTVQVLDVERNALTRIVLPSSSSIRILRAGHNSLTVNPNTETQSNLEQLYLNNNNLTKSAASIAGNPNLKVLNISMNQYETFPSLRDGANLQEFYAHNNQAIYIGSLSSINSKLVIMDVHSNRIRSGLQDLPDSLVYLDISDNIFISLDEVTKIPSNMNRSTTVHTIAHEEEPSAVLEMKKNPQDPYLAQFYNSVVRLTDGYVGTFDIRDNQITYLPDFLEDAWLAYLGQDGSRPIYQMHVQYNIIDIDVYDFDDPLRERLKGTQKWLCVDPEIRFSQYFYANTEDLVPQIVPHLYLYHPGRAAIAEMLGYSQSAIFNYAKEKPSTQHTYHFWFDDEVEKNGWVRPNDRLIIVKCISAVYVRIDGTGYRFNGSRNGMTAANITLYPETLIYEDPNSVYNGGGTGEGADGEDGGSEDGTSGKDHGGYNPNTGSIIRDEK